VRGETFMDAWLHSLDPIALRIRQCLILVMLGAGAVLANRWKVQRARTPALGL
jgi:hypothetical protein